MTTTPVSCSVSTVVGFHRELSYHASRVFRGVGRGAELSARGDRADHALAMEHLNAAGALFAKRGVEVYLDQVIAKEAILKA